MWFCLELFAVVVPFITGLIYKTYNVVEVIIEQPTIQESIKLITIDVFNVFSPYVCRWMIAASVVFGCLGVSYKFNYKDMLYITNRSIALVHSLFVIVYSSKALLITNGDDLMLSSTELILLSYSTGYFIYDLIYMLCFEFSLPFICHHLIALGYVGIVAYTKNGLSYYSLLILLLAELTNPIHLMIDMCRKYKWDRVNNILFPLFTISFIFLRVICIPILTVKQHIWLHNYSSVHQHIINFWIGVSLLITFLNFYWANRINIIYWDKFFKEQLGNMD